MANMPLLDTPKSSPYVQNVWTFPQVFQYAGCLKCRTWWGWTSYRVFGLFNGQGQNEWIFQMQMPNLQIKWSCQDLLKLYLLRRSTAGPSRPLQRECQIHSGAGSICARRTIALSYRESQANFFPHSVRLCRANRINQSSRVVKF